MEKPQRPTKIFRSEHLIQTESIMLFRNEFERKGLGVIIPIPNELAAKRKDITICVGVSDTIIAMKNRVIFCEFKTGYNNQRQAQKEFQLLVERLGFEYHIIRTVEQFKELVYEMRMQTT